MNTKTYQTLNINQTQMERDHKKHKNSKTQEFTSKNGTEKQTWALLTKQRIASNLKGSCTDDCGDERDI